MQRFETPEGVPCYILFAGEELDPAAIPETLCYVFGKGGYYIHRKNNLYAAVVSAKEFEMLGEIKEQYKLTVCKIPYETFMRIRSFFMDVFKKHKSEVAILLHYNFETKTWIWTVPTQTVAAASVHYDAAKGQVVIGADGELLAEMPAGYTVMGSIHSHASMQAFHSGTDTNDEFKFDGIHITLGSFDTPSTSFSARWMIASKELKADMADIIQGVPQMEYPAEEAMKMVSASAVAVYQYGGTGRIGFDPDGEGFDYRRQYQHGGVPGVQGGKFQQAPQVQTAVGQAANGAHAPGTVIVGDAEKKTGQPSLAVPGVVIYD